MSSKDLVQEWMKQILSGDISDEGRNYILNGWPRYVLLLDLVEQYANKRILNGSEQLSLLDVGPHFLTILLRQKFPYAVINTLGYEAPWLSPSPKVQDHCTFDLNNSQFPEQWPKFHGHDIIIMSEVIEHLYTAPWFVLRFIKTLMKPDGILIVSTPNASAIINRIFLALGRNPFEMIRESRENPGHFREYTQAELIDIGTKAGLNVLESNLENYFISPNKLIKRLYKLTWFHKSFRNGLIVVYRNS